MIQPNDPIICVNDSRLATDRLPPPISSGKGYLAQQVARCRCGNMWVDVGFRLNPQEHHISCSCGQKYMDGIWWFDQRRFSKGKPGNDGGIEVTITETITRTRTVTFKLPQ